MRKRKRIPITKWCQEIVKLETGVLIKDTKKPRKTKIPKCIKNNSWDKYIGKNIGEALCICCNMNLIDSKNFIGGHIISEKNGGSVKKSALKEFVKDYITELQVIEVRLTEQLKSGNIFYLKSDCYWENTMMI